MRCIITGAGGFVGRKLAAAIAAAGALGGERVDELVLFDVAPPPKPAGPTPAISVGGDIANPFDVAALVTPNTRAVFHLAAVVSGQAEAEFDLGYRVNLDGIRHVLEACRRLPRPPRFVFTSSIAAYGGALPTPIGDAVPLNPQTCYGVQKVIGEQLVNDYTRKGMIDGRSLRLPTVVVRAGKPNAAASGFASSIVREPLQGEAYACPVGPETRMWVASPRAVTQSLLHACDLPGEEIGADRGILLRGFSVSMGEAVQALARVAGKAVAERVSWRIEPTIDGIVKRWVSEFAAEKAARLGFPADRSIDDLIRDFIEDDLAPEHRAALRA
jgi:nucleoside-diphosphate-sugar epimerase